VEGVKIQKEEHDLTKWCSTWGCFPKVKHSRLFSIIFGHLRLLLFL